MENKVKVHDKSNVTVVHFKGTFSELAKLINQDSNKPKKGGNKSGK